MEDLFVLNEICRLCLVSKTKERSLLLFEITEQKQNRFEELTQTNVSEMMIGAFQIFSNQISSSYN